MGWFGKLKAGLSKSSSKITEGISGVLTRRKLDDAMLEELEEVLITTDMGAGPAAKMTAALAKQRFDKEVTDEEVREVLAAEVAKLLEPVVGEILLDKTRKPHVILCVGVNGNGKTTTIGKLAHQWVQEGKQVRIAACDTFRAAAVEQLQQWGQRAGCPVFTGAAQQDPASVAFQALEVAQNAGDDVLLIDTAGRLQTKQGLMDELGKIARVLQKLDADAPHTTLLVLDATTGQNAHSQVQAFSEAANLTGLVVTKLDGTAKGGVVVALAEAFGLPIVALGVGEGTEDLRPFAPEDFGRSLMGLS